MVFTLQSQQAVTTIRQRENVLRNVTGISTAQKVLVSTWAARLNCSWFVVAITFLVSTIIMRSTNYSKGLYSTSTMGLTEWSISSLSSWGGTTTCSSSWVWAARDWGRLGPESSCTLPPSGEEVPGGIKDLLPINHTHAYPESVTSHKDQTSQNQCKSCNTNVQIHTR